MQALLELYDKDPKPRPILSSANELSHSRWYIENLTIDRRIGVGTYSKVFSAHSFDNSVCVLKILDDLTPTEATDYLKKLIAASQFCGSLAHSLNVVQIYRFESRIAWKGNYRVHQIVVTSQKMAHNLWDLHKEKVRLGQPWTQDQLIKILISITNAMSEASKKDTPHYDVHERNIFIEEKKGIFLLGDFGVPKIIKKRRNLGPYVDDYLAPEGQKIMGVKDPVDFYKLDVYALGLVIVKLMSMKESFPVKDRSKVLGLLKEKTKEYPLLVQILEKQMLAANPAERQDAKNVKYFILTISFDLAFSQIKFQDFSLKKRVLGVNNLETKEEMREGYDVAQVYQHFGLLDQASFEYIRVLAACEKHEDYSKESAQIKIMCSEKLGVISIENENYDAALDTFTKLQEYLKKDAIAFLIGDNHPLYIHINHYLAVIYYHKDELAQAMYYLEQAHELGKTKNSNDSEVNVKIRDHFLGIMRFLKCDYGKALDHMLSVADFLTGVTRRDPLDTIDSLLMVANYYRSLKGHQLALDVFLKAKEMIMEAHGERSEEYINVMREIATTQKSLKDLKGAFNIQLNMLEKIRQTENKNLFADSLMELADTLFGQKKYNEALFSAEMAFKVFNRLYWLRHEKTLKAFRFLMNLVKKSPNKDALKHYQKFEEIMFSESIVRQRIARKNREQQS